MMIRTGNPLSVRRQSDLLGLNRSRLYYKAYEDTDTLRASLIAEVYRQYPMYGYRRIQAHLRDHGHVINREVRSQIDAEVTAKSYISRA